MSIYTYCLIWSMLFLIITLFFIKKRLLEFGYSILWIVTSIIMVVLSLNKSLTEKFAHLLNISYPPAVLFLTGMVFILLLMFYITIVVSNMQGKITRLIQELAVLHINSDKENLIK